jgi:hypothetical protein
LKPGSEQFFWERAQFGSINLNFLWITPEMYHFSSSIIANDREFGSFMSDVQNQNNVEQEASFWIRNGAPDVDLFFSYLDLASCKCAFQIPTKASQNANAKRI